MRRKKLILTGTCKEDKLPQEDAAQGAYGYSALRLQEASSYYDLVLPAWQSVGRRLQICTQEELLQAELVRASLGYNSRQKLFEEAGKEPEAAELALCERLQKPYAHENLAGLFVKTTVSELKKRRHAGGSCGRAYAVPGGRGRAVSAAVCQGTGRNRERDDTGKCVPQTAGDFPL